MLLDLAIDQTAGDLFYQSHGLPAAILGSAETLFTYDRHQFELGSRIALPPRVFLAKRLNITGWKKLLPTDYQRLAPHSLTPADLAREVARFAERLKTTDGPLIAIVIADKVNHMGRQEALFGLIEAEPKARFVLSSAPRSETDDFSQFCRDFRSRLNPAQQDRLATFDFHADAAGLNPYKALLMLADHFIIVGESQSMLSERLLAGRGVYHCGLSRPAFLPRLAGEALVASGKVKYFPATGPLQTERFEPIDTTSLVADRLAKDFTGWQVGYHEDKPDNPLDFVKAQLQRALALASVNQSPTASP